MFNQNGVGPSVTLQIWNETNDKIKFEEEVTENKVHKNYMRARKIFEYMMPALNIPVER